MVVVIFCLLCGLISLKKTSRGMDSGASDSPIIWKSYRIDGVKKYGLDVRILHRFSKFCVDCNGGSALFFRFNR